MPVPAWPPLADSLSVPPGMLFSVALIDKAKEAKEKDKQAAYTATIGKMYGGAEFFHTADQKLYASFLVKRFDTEGEQVALVADPATRNGHVQGQGAVRLSNRSRRHSADEATRGSVFAAVR